MKATIHERYISLPELARMLGINPQTARNWDRKGLLPEPLRIGRTRRYNLETVRKWMQEGCPSQAEVEAVQTGVFGLNGVVTTVMT